MLRCEMVLHLQNSFKIITRVDNSNSKRKDAPLQMCIATQNICTEERESVKTKTKRDSPKKYDKISFSCILKDIEHFVWHKIQQLNTISH